MANLICRHNKYGHCKFQDLCNLNHVNEKCEDIYCEIVNCQKRHPRKCKFFLEYKRCKFGDFCSYEHLLDDRANDIEDLKKELAAVKAKVQTLEKHIEDENIEFKKAFINFSEKQDENF